MMRYAKGGQRYLPGEMPKEDVYAFQVEGSVISADDIPADDLPPDYPSPAETGG